MSRQLARSLRNGDRPRLPKLWSSVRERSVRQVFSMQAGIRFTRLMRQRLLASSTYPNESNGMRGNINGYHVGFALIILGQTPPLIMSGDRRQGGEGEGEWRGRW